MRNISFNGEKDKNTKQKYTLCGIQVSLHKFAAVNDNLNNFNILSALIFYYFFSGIKVQIQNRNQTSC